MTRPTYDQATRLNDGDLLAMLVSGRNPDGSLLDTIINLFESTVLLAALAEDESGWFDLDALGVKDIIIRRVSANVTGAYEFELDWSRDGATDIVTETIAVADKTSVEKKAAARFMRVRIRNADGTSAFTAHYTGVEGR